MQNLYATDGVGIAVKTSLKSPEVYNWLLEFVGVMINIGYLLEVQVVYTTYLKDKDPMTFLILPRGM